MAESPIPAFSNKDHQPRRLASFTPRADARSESFQFHDSSKKWLTAQVILRTLESGYRMNLIGIAAVTKQIGETAE
jgi:hypothetical protein